MLFESHTPRVHAVIVHHRGLEMLDDCLCSLLDSAAVELQIIVVSNGCEEPLPEIAELSPRVHVTAPPQPVGFSEANNVGAAWAKEHLGPADAYYFVNNDTESKPATLDLMLHAMEQHGAGIAGPLTLIHAAPDHINSVGIRITEDAGAWDDGIGLSFDAYGELEGVREVAAVTGSALLIHNRVFDELGGWNEVYEWYYEDIDLCLRAWKRGYPVIHVPDAIILHRISATMSEGSERKLFYFRRNRLLIGLLHWPGDVLRKLLWRAVYHEIIRAPRAHSAMHRRALGDIVKNLPKYWRLRREGRGDDSWRRFIEPLGSVPAISLPELTTADDDQPSSVESVAAKPRLPSFDGVRAFRNDEKRKRFLLLGWGPLPIEPATMHFAPGGRTWQLASALARDGHRVLIVTAHMPGSGEPPTQWGEEKLNDLLMLVRFDRQRFEEPGLLEALVEAFVPQAIVAAAPVPCERAVDLGTSLPIWADLFGDPIAEAQAKAMTTGDDGDHLSAYLRLMNRVLERGDAFSAVSGRQKWALVGQLGLTGRLNAAVGGTAIVHSMPCAGLDLTLPAYASDEESAGGAPKGEANGTRAEATASESIASDAFTPPEDSIVALWSGSFNTWCDIETLYAGVERALEKEPRLVFVATGGAVAGHDETTYERLLELLEDSKNRDRWHLLGSLPKDEFARLRQRADFGVVTEKTLYERLLGSSGRILDWLHHGRPMVCTSLSEIGGTVGHGGFGVLYLPGDGASLAKAILHLARLPESERRAMGEAGRRHAEEHLSIVATTEPLRIWAVDPRRAPDVTYPRPDYVDVTVRGKLQPVREELELRNLENAQMMERLHRQRSELGQIHQSSMWKLWTGYHDFRRFLLKLVPGRRG